MNLKTQFKEDAEGTRVEVLALSSKKGGISVRVRRKAKGEKKFAIGMREVFAADKETEAKARYEALVSEAQGEGWEVTKTAVGSPGRFSEMPKPAGKAKAEPEPKAAKSGKNAK